MTLRLYYDSDALTFDARVIDHDGDPTRVVLDRTAFYPTSGGQPHDTGTLAGVNVVDVIDDDDRVIHVVDAPLQIGAVHGEIDAGRRRDFTVQHTAQHLLSAIAADRFGWDTCSVHFGERHATIELDTSWASNDELRALESACNRIIAAAVPVTISYQDASEAIDLRKPPSRDGVVRIVAIAGIDRSGCGGTHAGNTAQLGMIAINGVERIRGRIRLSYLAGERVLAELHQTAGLLDALAAATTTARAELLDVIPRRLQEGREQQKQVQALQQEVIGHRVSALLADLPGSTEGIRRLTLDAGFGPLDMLRQAASLAVKQPKTVCIAADADTRTVIFATSHDSGIDAGAELKRALADVGGRGGGSATMAQGSVPDREALDRVAAALGAG